MPDAPAPGLVLSRTTTSAPDPTPRERSSLARWYAVDSPWMPAPTTTYCERAGTNYCLFVNAIATWCTYRSLFRGQLPLREIARPSTDATAPPGHEPDEPQHQEHRKQEEEALGDDDREHGEQRRQIGRAS